MNKEFIPLDELNAEIYLLVGFASRGEVYNEDRLDHLFEWYRNINDFIYLSLY